MRRASSPGPPRRIHARFFVELNIQHVMAAIDDLDSELLGQRLERRVLKQVTNSFRHRAISILQFLFGTVAGRVFREADRIGLPAPFCRDENPHHRGIHLWTVAGNP